MDCRWARDHITAYVDGELEPGSRWLLRRHLMSCAACYEQYEPCESVGPLLKDLAPITVPSNLRARIQVALSRETRKGAWARWKVHVGNLMRPIAVPAAGGLLSALILFGALMSNLSISHRNFAEDVPLTFLANAWVSSPTMSVPSPFGVTQDIVVEAFIDGHGSVYDFRLIAAPSDNPGVLAKLKSELANALLTSKFQPATSFGRPVPGKMLISFRTVTRVTVRG